MYFMKRILLVFFSILAITPLVAQRFTDFGIIAGGCYYNGEINPTRLFYKTQPAFAGFFRWNIDKRHAVRISGYYMSLQGSDADFPDRVFTERNPTSFSAQLLDYNAQFEFNFLPYISGDDAWMHSLYVAGGLGYTLVLSGSGTLNIPFGVGMKINLTDRLSLGGEWSFRKTFTDSLDGVESPLGRNLINNNDWYSSVGLFISYKFVKFAADCPVYD